VPEKLPKKVIYKNEIIEAIKNGENVVSISRRLKIDSSYLCKLLKEWNIPYVKAYRKGVLSLSNFFETIEIEEQAYWLGFIYADGHIRKKKYVIDIVTSAKDKNHLLKLAKSLDYFYLTYKPKTNGYCLSLCSQKIWKDLKEKNENICETFWQLPKFLKWHFIRGFFDGDGTIVYSLYHPIKSINHCCIEFTDHIPFLETLKEFFEKEGYQPILKTDKNVKTETFRRLQLQKRKEILDCYHNFYSNATIYLERKKEKFDWIIQKLLGGKEKCLVFWKIV
jgi:intein/homing endonuclease